MQLRPTRTFMVEPALPKELSALADVAGNLFWTWNTDAQALFQRIDPTAWENSNHNPVRLLQDVSPGHLADLSTDPGFVQHFGRVREALESYLSRPPGVTVPGTSKRDVIAYFSLEFALTESFPNYSGGLGVLAGDHLKSASDLGLPLVGIGLLYYEGYFHQALGPDGWQEEEYRPIELGSQPAHLLRDDAGQPLCVQVPFAGRDVQAVLWQLDVGQTPLILLDTNVAANSPLDRAICSRLYGGDSEMRIQQEMLLGIGGVRAIQALGLQAAVCHMNEGHSALLAVERIRMLMEETGAGFEEARLPVSAATVFTTHTAVAAGIDLFPPELVRRHLGHYYAELGLDDHTFIGFGRTNPHDDHEPFSMALLGLRFSGFRNGVSKLHRRVSQRLWQSAWPNLPEDQVPIASVTNGVHLPSWVAHEIGGLYDEAVGPSWRDEPANQAMWERVHDVGDEALWNAHVRQRHRLLERAGAQQRETAARGGVPAPAGLDPEALTIGFARRFAGYKRATLLFRDPVRLAEIVSRLDRPVQFIFSGKAHPRDEQAKQLIREVLQYSRRPEFRGSIVLLERYDVDLARSLVQGCDAWLNTPLRPLEASGTSGMKAIANGALHISVKDGWWWEGFAPGLGWSIGNDRLDDDPEVQDALDAASLYDILENEVVPLFYERDQDGIPREWIARMKGSIAAYVPMFNTSRMVAEYATNAYAPSAESWRWLRADSLREAREQRAWLERVRGVWESLRILSVEDDAP
ncbi:MAG: alpha-glucan family phosphorylase, partial [Tepidiformaceae bacterium]